MSRATWGMVLAWGLLISVFIAAITATAMQPDPRVPQALPFNVYETPSACVYVVGAAQPAIAVIPRYYQRGSC